MKRCQRCNIDFADELKFCLTCGAELVTAKRSQPIDRERFVRCRTCRNFVREDAVVCVHCGASLSEEPPPLPPPRTEPPPTQRVPVPTLPIRSEATVPSLSMLEGHGRSSTQASSFRWWHGTILTLFLLLFGGALGAGGWWWWSHHGSAPQTQSQSNGNPGQSANNPSTTSSPAAASQRNSGEITSVSSADDDLKRLQERRSNAQPSESKEIVAAFERAERKYPSDYRFTFERARLFGKRMISHDESFDALFLAAEKAIDANKSTEMLAGMTTNQDGDFHRLSHGHPEWGVIMQALSNRDKAALKGHIH